MKSERQLARASDLLAPWAVATAEPEAGRLDVRVEAHALREAAGALREAEWGYLAAITGLDRMPDEAAEAPASLEALYHFCAGAAVVTVRVRLPRDAAHLPSLRDLFAVADFYEIELSEMFGIDVAGIERTEHLFLPDAWPVGLYPLRKDADLSQLHERSDHDPQ